MFELEKLYNRRKDIHEVLGGQMQGGIATPTKAPLIILFTGDAGEAHGYHDGYDEHGLFIYTGEGQEGDMQFVRGNKAIRDHIKDGKELLLFSSSKKKGMYRFKGSFICAGYDAESTGPDTNRNIRKLIRFQLIPTLKLNEPNQDSFPETLLPEQSLGDLRACAYAASEIEANTLSRLSMRNLYKRSSEVKAYVLARANGICESCRKPAPFFAKSGQPYLEAHHIRRLSDNGLDSPLWVAAICPSCHCEIHQGINGKEKNEVLKIYAKTVEQILKTSSVNNEGLHDND